MSEKEPSIDPSIDQRLRVFVERVVRPVATQETAKLRMRRDLLGHARDAYAEEAAKGGDASTALARTLTRLGDPQQTTEELQAGVRWDDRLMAWVDRVSRRAPSESRFRHALRIGAFGFFAVAAVSVPAYLVGEGVKYNAVGLWFQCCLCCWFGATMWIGTWFGDAIHDQLGAGAGWSRWLAAGRQAIAGAVLLMAAGWAFVFALGGTFPDPSQPCANWAILASLFVPAALLIAWLDRREREGLAEWLALDLS